MPLYAPLDPNVDHIRGPADAPVQLVEYGDFECPYCGQAFYEVHEVRRRLGRSICHAYRHFPLSRIHPHALVAAEAAEAAAAQGQFWQMHDMLFQNQSFLEQDDLIRYAEGIGLNAGSFETALATHEPLPKIRSDFFGGVRSGVNGTPCFFINGVRHDGPWDADSLTAALERALPAHVAPSALY